jgi:cellulose synthase/poly-beta-1,6-N-acetylglucosamine synthase-like glycosyltransferase
MGKGRDMAQRRWSKADLMAVAKYQKNILWMILISLPAFIRPITILLAGVIQAYFIYRLASALRLPITLLYMVLAFVPFVSLLSLFHLNSKATNLLQEHGITVGLMGARMAEFDDLQ